MICLACGTDVVYPAVGGKHTPAPVPGDADVVSCLLPLPEVSSSWWPVSISFSRWWRAFPFVSKGCQGTFWGCVVSLLTKSACHSIVACLTDKGCLMKPWFQGGPVKSLTLVKCCMLPKEPVVCQESVSTTPEYLPYDETGVG